MTDNTLIQVTRRGKKIKISILGILVFAGSGIGYYSYTAASTVTIDEKAFYQVTSVSDGDTFKTKVGTHPITVRLLGIDTPETVDPRKTVQCFGKEASNETKSLLNGAKVQLKLNPHREVTDKYGRYLAYVYKDDGLFVNKYLIENGYAHEYTYGTPYSFQKEFKAAEKLARENKKGLWGDVCANAEVEAKKVKL